MNETTNLLYITGPAGEVNRIANPDPYYASDPGRDLGTDVYGRKTLMHRFLTKRFRPGQEAVEAMVDKYHLKGVQVFLLSYYCGCYWLDLDPAPYTYSYIFAETYTAVPSMVPSVFLPGQGLKEESDGITIHRNRNRTLHENDTVTEVLFIDRSRGALVPKVVLEEDLFLQFYGDEGDDVW